MITFTCLVIRLPKVLDKIDKTIKTCWCSITMVSTPSTERLMLATAEFMLEKAVVELHDLIPYNARRLLMRLIITLVEKMQGGNNIPGFTEEPELVKLYVTLRRLVRKRVFDEMIFTEIMLECLK